VNDRISDIARRTVRIGEKVVATDRAQASASGLAIKVQTPETQPAELFKLGDLTKYWKPEWTLERAGFGAPGGAFGLFAEARSSTAMC
jgi:hypothetical protein